MDKTTTKGREQISSKTEICAEAEIRANGASQADNHPRLGSSIRVEPIRSQKDINLIRKILSDIPRDLAIFTIGINTNLRASDLLSIKVGQVRHLKPGEHFTIREKKTGKLRTITINRSAHTIIVSLLSTMPEVQDDNWLFQSRKGGGRMTVSYLSQMVKAWCQEINLRGNYGSHSLRKTWGYMMRTVHGVDIPTLMTVFNHSTQKQTLAYLCIQPEEIHSCYMKEI
jgi:integrase